MKLEFRKRKYPYQADFKVPAFSTCQCTHFSSFAVLMAYYDVQVTPLRRAAFNILMWNKFSHM